MTTEPPEELLGQDRAVEDDAAHASAAQIDAWSALLDDDASDDADLAADSVEEAPADPAGRYCRFCHHAVGVEAHLVGAASPGANRWCCDACWDERLR
jgi:hypothetical protein